MPEFFCTIHNNTGSELKLVSAEPPAKVWDVRPPEKIGVNEVARFGEDVNGNLWASLTYETFAGGPRMTITANVPGGGVNTSIKVNAEPVNSLLLPVGGRTTGPSPDITVGPVANAGLQTLFLSPDDGSIPPFTASELPHIDWDRGPSVSRIVNVANIQWMFITAPDGDWGEADSGPEMRYVQWDNSHWRCTFADKRFTSYKENSDVPFASSRLRFLGPDGKRWNASVT